jgi:hypothetical protein
VQGPPLGLAAERLGQAPESERLSEQEPQQAEAVRAVNSWNILHSKRKKKRRVQHFSLFYIFLPFFCDA